MTNGVATAFSNARQGLKIKLKKELLADLGLLWVPYGRLNWAILLYISRLSGCTHQASYGEGNRTGVKCNVMCMPIRA